MITPLPFLTGAALELLLAPLLSCRFDNVIISASVNGNAAVAGANGSMDFGSARDSISLAFSLKMPDGWSLRGVRERLREPLLDLDLHREGLGDLLSERSLLSPFLPGFTLVKGFRALSNWSSLP